MKLDRKQLFIAGIIVVIAVALGIQGYLQMAVRAPTEEPVDGLLHVYVDDVFIANVAPADALALEAHEFTDAEEGVAQAGPRLDELVLLYVDSSRLRDESKITVSGSRKGADKTASVTWAEAIDISNNIILDVSSSGDSLKLVSTLPRMDVRAEWVQGINRIDVTTKP